MKKLPQLFYLALIIPGICLGQGHESHSTSEEPAGVTGLSPELRTLLSSEMQQLQKGMTGILPLYVSGQWAEIAVIAGKMESSYVLKQQLSEKQMHELHTKLPAGFIELDQRFHYLAGMLEHVAERQKVELIGFYMSEMGEACVSCHTKYATQRFPALAPKAQGHEH